jgi:predicted RNase H-like HicB family nuclease
MTEMTFTFILEQDTDSGFVARCLELKGIYGQGDTEEEALNDVQQALDLALETYSTEKIIIPYHKIVQVTKNVPSSSTST